MRSDRGGEAGFVANLGWGLGLGLVGAVGLSLIALALAALRGSTWYPQYGLSTWAAIGIYFAAGPAAGLVLGALRPLLRWRAGAALVGYLTAVVVYGGAGLLMGEAPGRVPLVAALCGLGGAVAGAYWWPDGP